MTAPPDSWPGDLLGRRHYAEFLTRYLDGLSKERAAGQVVALDAPWGFGKTFFVRRWTEDLRAANRAVVLFDAWENDAAEDPAIAFMAELRAAITPLYDAFPAGGARVAEAQAALAGATKALRKAAMPAAVVIGKSMLKKFTGIAIDEVLAAGDQAEEEAQPPQEPAEAGRDALEKGLDTYFEKALEGHAQRLGSVRAFRESLERLLDLLLDTGVISGPLYVFIDELDRCRPDYALRLLEGIKHLFSVRGVIFVASINLTQLSRAVGAVYGSEFDGAGYLKRFFDVEYRLPEPTRDEFVRAELVGTALERFGGLSGLDPALGPGTPAEAFTVIAHALNLDLRAIQRVRTIAEAAVLGAEEPKSFVALWLFFLAAIRYKHPDFFEQIATGKPLLQIAFEQTLDNVLVGLTTIRLGRPAQRGASAEISLKAPLSTLYRVMISPDALKEILERDEHPAPYPERMVTITLDHESSFHKVSVWLRRHVALVASAGFIGQSAVRRSA